MPNTIPLVRKKRQSASFWFQCASLDSARPPAASVSASWSMERCSIAPIAHLIFGWLAEARHRARDPIGGPRDQLRGVHDRKAEQSDSPRRVGEPCGRLFLADEDRLA